MGSAVAAAAAAGTTAGLEKIAKAMATSEALSAQLKNRQQQASAAAGQQK
ncbi:hypothetical protein INH39_30390 [Massilia violaceinigra]|uniref:Uncharacterized protein n=1 Tax=Massilia violaceinigra TaxID=2045208 RepID=A0ABY4A4D0_9BURK|nr:hypothetical protein [Massilia violaceinigra]UOD29646.1 hypothetical protein INH39_30390 [Massilia violaceinigra]